MDDFNAVLAASEAYDGKLIFWEETNHAFSPPPKAIKRVLIVIGPEGGFTKGEYGFAISKGFKPVSLGPNILRAETAAVAAAAVILNWREMQNTK